MKGFTCYTFVCQQARMSGYSRTHTHFHIYASMCWQNKYMPLHMYKYICVCERNLSATKSKVNQHLTTYTCVDMCCLLWIIQFHVKRIHSNTLHIYLHTIFMQLGQAALFATVSTFVYVLIISINLLKSSEAAKAYENTSSNGRLGLDIGNFLFFNSS